MNGKINRHGGIDTASIISNWLKHALDCEQMKRDHFDSAHLDELSDRIPRSPGDQVELALALYAELIKQYEPISGDYVAQLIIDLDYDLPIGRYTLEQVIDGSVRMHSPPEIFLAEREVSSDIYLKPGFVMMQLPQNDIAPNNGVVKAYFVYPTADLEDSTQFFLYEHRLV